MIFNRSNAITFGGNVSGTGALTQQGADALTLTGNNTYTCVTTITVGTLSVATIGDGGIAGNLGQASNAAGNIVFNGGTLQYTGAIFSVVAYSPLAAMPASASAVPPVILISVGLAI